jgi:hypothetical protein
MKGVCGGWLREERAGFLPGSSFVPATEREKRLGIRSEERGNDSCGLVLWFFKREGGRPTSTGKEGKMVRGQNVSGQ